MLNKNVYLGAGSLRGSAETRLLSFPEANMSQQCNYLDPAVFSLSPFFAEYSLTPSVSSMLK